MVSPKSFINVFAERLQLRVGTLKPSGIRKSYLYAMGIFQLQVLILNSI